MRRDGKDPDRISDGGVFDRYRQMGKRELGIRDQKEQKLNEDDVQEEMSVNEKRWKRPRQNF